MFAVIVILVKAQRAVALELEPPEGCAAGRQEGRLWALLGSCFPPSKMGLHTFLVGQGQVSQVGSCTVLRRAPDQSLFQTELQSLPSSPLRLWPPTYLPTQELLLLYPLELPAPPRTDPD